MENLTMKNLLSQKEEMNRMFGEVSATETELKEYNKILGKIKSFHREKLESIAKHCGISYTNTTKDEDLRNNLIVFSKKV